MVDTIGLDQAVSIIEREHYAGGAARTAVFRHGLFKRDEWPFTIRGCALWMPPINAAARATFPDDWQAVLALSRLAIEPEVPTNGASFFLAQSEKLIRQDGRWKCLVTYADEWQGHTGAIYLAAGWTFVGYTQTKPIYVKNGRLTSVKATRTRTHAEMLALGAEKIGKSRKLKFVKLL